MMKKRRSKSNWAKTSAVLALSLATLPGQTLETTFRKEGKTVRESFESVTEKFQKNSAVFYDSLASQYGVVVSSDGLVMVKASELETYEKPSIVIGKKLYRDFTILATDPIWDVSLVRVDVEGLTPVEFSDVEPSLGTIVISNAGTGRFARYAQMGVIAANARAVGVESLAVLGLVLSREEGSEELRVGKIFAKSGAEEAGVLENDIVTGVDGRAITSAEEFLAALTEKVPGDRAELSILREPAPSEKPLSVDDPFGWKPKPQVREELTLEVELFERQNVFETQQTRNDAMSGRISKRRTHFPRVLQHDTSLTTRTTGGPLLDLEGRCVGMNIAYASRECSYAIPAKELQELLADLREKAGI